MASERVSLFRGSGVNKAMNCVDATVLDTKVTCGYSNRWLIFMVTLGIIF